MGGQPSLLIENSFRISGCRGQASTEIWPLPPLSSCGKWFCWDSYWYRNLRNLSGRTRHSPQWEKKIDGLSLKQNSFHKPPNKASFSAFIIFCVLSGTPEEEKQDTRSCSSNTRSNSERSMRLPKFCSSQGPMVDTNSCVRDKCCREFVAWHRTPLG